MAEHAGILSSSPAPPVHEANQSLLLLPDDVVLHVMRNLDVPTLFKFRLVCRRLAGLSLHPDVWRHRHVSPFDPWLSAVLRLAPCLASLSDGFTWTDSEDIQSLFATTRCAVAELDVGAYPPEQSARIIRNQVALGRLRDLRVSRLRSSVLMEAVLAATSILHTLLITTDRDFEPCTPSRHNAVSPSPSLKCFKYGEYGPPAAEFCTKILACHTTTLEIVRLGWCIDLCACNTLAPLLATMPHLKKLTCCPLSDMKALASCPLLQDVHLSIPSDGYNPPDAIRDTAMFLRRAGQLRKVTLTLARNDVGTELVEAVGPSVESLALQSTELPDEVFSKLRPQLRALVRVLPSLQSLVRLRVGVHAVPDELLLAITPASAPAALRSLQILDWAWERDEQETGEKGALCAHDFLHRRAVKVLLQANPTLKLYVACSEFSCAAELTCDACKQGCDEECEDGCSSMVTCGACKQGCDKECKKLLAGILSPNVFSLVRF